ncbi:hypothetical protein Pav631_3679 [Pseudomonas avellanae BPIC 631]|nr:hypothetical protein Pav631_3679 [Pseudomonas avellanae BPIC 631]
MFSDDLDAHNSAVRDYQLKRRADYRSSPVPAAAPAPAPAADSPASPPEPVTAPDAPQSEPDTQ